MKKKIKIGLDFDGVVAYNPFRVVRAPVTAFKRHILGIEHVKFFVPKNSLQRLVWGILHESSVFPAKGWGLLKEVAARDDVELHLVTARFGYLQPQLTAWLKRWGMHDIFDSIHMNVADEQPHIYKEKKLRKLGLDYFVEDNWDIVEYLHDKTKTDVFWIYNVTDRGYTYPNKFPYLEKALQKIVKK